MTSTSRLDRHYTPVALADLLVQQARVRRVDLVADFAAGDGALLKAARRRWPKSTMVANDVDPEAARLLRRVCSDRRGIVSTVDFLDEQSVRRSAIGTFRGKCDLVVLNPPYSCLGSTRVGLTWEGESIQCSPSVAFLLKGLSFLRSRAEAVALLPAGALDSHRDSRARAAIEKFGHVEVLHEFGRGAFAGCMQRTVLVRVRQDSWTRSASVPPAPSIGTVATGLRITIVRGSIKMHEHHQILSRHGIPLIHSTALRAGSVPREGLPLVQTTRSTTRGPAILIPRVGAPSAEKVCVLKSPAEVALSDCVVALEFDLPEQADATAKSLTNGHWSTLERAYSGSCAPFVTMDRLAQALSEVGLAPSFKGRRGSASHVWATPNEATSSADV